MAACGAKLRHMFERPLSVNPTLRRNGSLSWNHHRSNNTRARQSSFTEIFGELYFKEELSRSRSPPPSMPCTGANHDEPQKQGNSSEDTRKLVRISSKCYIGNHKISYSFSSMSSESLQLCTEGLGFESSDDPETQDYWHKGPDRAAANSPARGEIRRPRVRREPFPPPISCMGKSGKPRVYFKSYKYDGRLVLKEIMIPTQDCLHASREDGRLKLHFAHKDDDSDYPTVYGEDLQKKDREVTPDNQEHA